GHRIVVVQVCTNAVLVTVEWCFPDTLDHRTLHRATGVAIGNPFETVIGVTKSCTINGQVLHCGIGRVEYTDNGVVVVGRCEAVGHTGKGLDHRVMALAFQGDVFAVNDDLLNIGAVGYGHGVAVTGRVNGRLN